MPTIEANGLAIHYERQGEGPTLMLIAGMASDVASWTPVIEQLAARYDVVAFDNRCAGRTLPSPAPVSRDLMVADCVAVMDMLDIAAAHVLGHSLGAMVGLNLAARHPDRVTSLVAAAAGPAVLPMRLSLFEDLAAIYETDGVPVDLWFRLLFPWLFRPAFFDDRAAVEAASRMAADYPHRQSAAAFRAQVAGLADFLAPPDLGRIACPVLALAAEHDLLFAASGIAAKFSGLRRLSSAVVSDAGHSLHWDNPAGFVDAVTAFHAGLA